RAVQRRKVRHLYLRQQVDADQPVVITLREMHLHEARKHRDLLTRLADLLPPHRKQLVRRALRTAIRKEVRLERTKADLRERKALHCRTDVQRVEAVLQPPHEYGIDAG